MAEAQSVITDEMRKLIGVESEPWLHATSQIAKIEETSGRLGPMVIVTTETIYRRGNTIVAKLRGTGIRY